MRDVLFLPSMTEKEIVISTDCSGGIGEKDQDVVFAPDRVVAYFSMRVAMMEIMAVGAIPSTVILSNFTGDQSWKEYMNGINQVFTELEINPLPVVGSTETNMSLLQSAMGLTILGDIHKENKKIKKTPANAYFAVIGEPLVGEAVLTEKQKVAPLSLFKKCLEIVGVYEIVPIGSKGILYEFDQLLDGNDIDIKNCKVNSSLDINAAAGPATCFLVSYQKSFEDSLQKIAGQHFHKLSIVY